MQFCAYQPYSNNNIWPLHKSEVFYDLKTTEESTAILKKMSAANLQKQLITSDSFTFDSNHSEQNTCNILVNETLQRTPSPILLSYCKEILDKFDVSVKPVYKNGEPLLSHEDLQLLSQIVKSNEHYHYLGEKHTKLLKQILELNLCQQAKNKEGTLSKTLSSNSSNENKSELELLETFLLEEVSTGDELELSWRIVEEIFSRRSRVEKNESSESINFQEMCDTSLEDTLSETSPDSQDEVLSISNAYSSISTCAEDNNVPDEEVLLGVTKIGLIADHDIFTTKQNNSDVQSEPDSKRGSIFQMEEILKPTDFLVEFIYDMNLSSDASSPVPPPSDASSFESQLPKLLTTGQNYSLPATLPVLNRSSNTGFSSSEEDLYTDQVFRRTEAKLLDAISHRLAYTPDLPMSLSMKTIKLLDIRRRRTEPYRLQVEVPKSEVMVLHILELIGLCEEFEIRQFTFAELAQLGHFYKIEQTKNGVSMHQTNLQDIVFNPEHLLGMLTCKRKPTMSERLADKIRGSYDSTKYAEIFEDIMELDLYSAKSQSESDFEDINSTHFLKKYDDSEAEGEYCLKSETVNNINRIGVLFDNNQYGNQNSSRSRFCTDDAYTDRGVVDESQTEVLNALLDKFYEIDPLTIGDLMKYINNLKMNSQEDTEVEFCDKDNDSLGSKPSSCSFSSATSGFLSVQEYC